MISLASAVRVLAVLLVLGSEVSGQRVTVAIRNNNVKARRTPGRTGKLVETLSRDQRFTVVEEVPNWFRIRLRPRVLAWVPKNQTRVLAEDIEEDPEHGENPEPVDPGAFRLSNFLTLPDPEPVADCTPTTIPADFSICPADGSGGGLARAYVQKNRLEVPCAYRTITPEQILALPLLPRDVRSLPDDHPQRKFLAEAEAIPVRLDGFLAMTKNGGKEGVNCSIPGRFDLRLEIVARDDLDPKQTRPRHVVSEATPWFRALFSSWNPSVLRDFASYSNGFNGGFQRAPVPIRVYGHLFFDEGHLTDGSIGTVRGTVWEVHPVTRIEVFDQGAFRKIE